VAEFFALDQATLLASLSSRHLQVMGAPPSGDQAEAWRGEYEILGAALRESIASTPRAGKWGVVFEYELPHERGRRPDVVILTGAQVLVPEFKETATLLEAHVDQVAHAEAMERQGFRLYLTRELEPARGYVRERYRTEEEKRYGFVGLSKGRLNPFGIPTDYFSTQRMKIGPWYYDDPDSPGSCCQLNSAATEFQCQGLELDLPIVGWGVDLRWNGRSWQSPPQRRFGDSHRQQARDPHKLRLNSYRVLLTRRGGRAGGLRARCRAGLRCRPRGAGGRWGEGAVKREYDARPMCWA